MTVASGFPSRGPKCLWPAGSPAGREPLPRGWGGRAESHSRAVFKNTGRAGVRERHAGPVAWQSFFKDNYGTDDNGERGVPFNGSRWKRDSCWGERRKAYTNSAAMEGRMQELLGRQTQKDLMSKYECERLLLNILGGRVNSNAIYKGIQIP